MQMLHVITGTPWWVWVILGYLVFIGISNFKDTVVRLGRLFIVPAFFSVFSIISMYKNYGFTPLSLGCWALGMAVGSVLGWFFYKNKGVTVVSRSRRLIKIPGGISTLVVFLGFFVIRYSRAVILLLYPSLMFIREVMMADLIGAGFFIGFLVGRLAFCFNLLHRSKSR